MATSKSRNPIVPVKSSEALFAAGGGNPSTASTFKTIDTFSPSVLTHLNKIFHSICSETDHGSLSQPQARDFLRSVQHDTTPTNMTAQPFAKLENGFDDFLAYMASPVANAMQPIGHQKTPDLRHPLPHYFISSSHNTYLEGNQLYSESTSNAYRNVLRRGCRCLEIDVWDGDESSSSSDSSDSEDESAKKNGSRREAIKSKISGRIKRVRSKVRSPRSSPPSAAEKPVTEKPMPAPEELTLPAPWTTASTAMRAEPRVLHGYTLTKEVPFREVCEAIHDSAFESSDLPIIVSLEVHAGLEQQQIMVEIMRHTWKGHLVNLRDLDGKEIGTLPSPDQLRRKILVKVKWTPPPDSENEDGEGTNNPVEIIQTTSSADDDQSPEGRKRKKSSKILHALSQFGIYTQSYSFKHLEQPEAKIPNHVFSLSEKKVADVHETQAKALFDHNRNFLMRAYPSGMRVMSSNLEPTFFWRQGIQMVALNWQRWDKGMMLNEGMFSGEQGWVLKPEGYRETDLDTPKISRQTLDMTIKLLAGQDLPVPEGERHSKKFRPYVKIALHVGQPEEISKAVTEKDKGDSASFKRKSNTLAGIEPDFEGEALQFAGIQNVIEDLAFVRLKIQHEKFGKDELAAWACVRLNRLQQGYRFIHLLDAKGLESHGVLLVKITKRLS